MLVCHCKRVSDRTIRAAVQSGATCRGAVANACGAGTGCGGCVPMVERLITEENRERASFSLPILATAV